MAHQPGAPAQQRQGGRPREEAGPQAQEEPRGEEERGDDHGIPERLGRQRRHASGRDRGGGEQTHSTSCHTLTVILFIVAALSVITCGKFDYFRGLTFWKSLVFIFGC